MTNPTKYVPGYSYSSWQATNPAKPLPAGAVDNDFARIKLTTDQTIDALADVRRSDGALANSIVTSDSLSPDLSIGFTMRGGWLVATKYNAGDGVAYQGGLYRARVTNTSVVGNAPNIDVNTWQYLFAIADMAGIMSTLTYDPNNHLSDAFNRANHTGAQAISTVTNLQANLDTIGLRTVFDVPENHAGVGDGVTDDTAAIAATETAAGVGREVLLRKSYLVSAYSNPLGNIFKGGGRILTAVTGGFWQRNTYADHQRLHIGREYANRFFQYLKNGQGSGGGTNNIHLFGDSRIAGGNGETLSVTAALTAALQNRGLPNFFIANHGVGGTQWSDLNALPYLVSGTASTFIIEYGANDAAVGLTQMATNMDAKLGAIRAATNGSIANLFILLVGPSTMSDSPNNRDERWFEQVRGIYIAMARKYQCAYFDAYGHMQDGRGAAGLWMDNPYGDGRAVHPLDAMNAWTWGGLVDEFFGVGAIAPYAVNRFLNEGALTNNVIVGQLPDQYPFGMTVYRATSVNGWPEDGFVRTTRNVDSGVLQEFFPYASGRTRVYKRVAYVGGNSWNRWTGVSEAITLVNSWVNFSGAAVVTLHDSGLVSAQVSISGGVTTVANSFGTLPAGLAPSTNIFFGAVGNSVNPQVKVQPDGAMVWQTAGDAVRTSFSACWQAA